MTTFTYQLFVKASPEAVWDALTNPDQIGRYGYGGRTEYDLRAGGSYTSRATEEMKAFGRPDVVVEGAVIEADAPRRLVQTWHALFDPDLAAEPATRLTVETEAADPRMFPEGGVAKATLTHELDGAPKTAAIVSRRAADAGGGCGFDLSDLKTTLETGTSFHGR